MHCLYYKYHTSLKCQAKACLLTIKTYIMKTKITLLRACIIMAIVLAGYYAPAQQAQSLNTSTDAGKETATEKCRK